MVAEVGMVYGPWQDNLTWRLARVTDIKNLPDSVKASHILIRPVNNTDFDAAQKTADSIVIDEEMVQRTLEGIVKDRDLSRYIL